jgi:hypothetical protein
MTVTEESSDLGNNPYNIILFNLVFKKIRGQKRSCFLVIPFPHSLTITSLDMLVNYELRITNYGVVN